MVEFGSAQVLDRVNNALNREIDPLTAHPLHDYEIWWQAVPANHHPEYR